MNCCVGECSQGAGLPGQHPKDSVAYLVLVVAVRVLDCQGHALTSNVIAGLDWLAQKFQLPAVASLSLGADSPNSAMDDAVKALIALGVTVVVAAGNFNQSKLHVPGKSDRMHESLVLWFRCCPLNASFTIATKCFLECPLSWLHE